jgi:hypothetical protein
MVSEEMAKSTVQQAMDQGRNAAEKASRTMQDGYKAAQQCAEDKGLTWVTSSGVNRGWRSPPRSRSVMLWRE